MYGFALLPSDVNTDGAHVRQIPDKMTTPLIVSATDMTIEINWLAPVDPATGMPLGPETAQMDLGKPVMEPEVDGSSTQVNGKIAEMPKGGEI